jgi:hypothetical protein
VILTGGNFTRRLKIVNTCMLMSFSRQEIEDLNQRVHGKCWNQFLSRTKDCSLLPALIIDPILTLLEYRMSTATAKVRLRQIRKNKIGKERIHFTNSAVLPRGTL